MDRIPVPKEANWGDIADILDTMFIQLEGTTPSILSCRNETGAIIPVGAVCFLGADTGNGPALTLANADGQATISLQMVMATADIANNANGDCQLLPGVVTGLTGLTPGSSYHVDTTAGQITATALTFGFKRIVGQALSATSFLWADSGVYIGVTDPDTENPSVPANLSSTAVQQTEISLSWSAATDNTAISYYILRRGGVQVGGNIPAATLTYTDTGLTASTEYSYTIEAVDTSSNTSGQSAAVAITTSAASDTEAPTAPTNFTGTANGTAIDYTWTAATDNVGVTEYRIMNGTTVIQSGISGAATSFSLTDLDPETEYTYTLVARDLAGNQSTHSNADTTTTGSAAAPQVTFDTTESTTALRVDFDAGATATIHWSDGSTSVLTSGSAHTKDFGSTAARSHYLTVEPATALTRFGSDSENDRHINNVDGLDGFVNLNFLYFPASSSLTTMDISNCSSLLQLHLAFVGADAAQWDQWLIDLAAATGDVSSETTALYAHGSTRTSASDAARATLVANGWNLVSVPS